MSSYHELSVNRPEVQHVLNEQKYGRKIDRSRSYYAGYQRYYDQIGCFMISSNTKKLSAFSQIAKPNCRRVALLNIMYGIDPQRYRQYVNKFRYYTSLPGVVSRIAKKAKKEKLFTKSPETLEALSKANREKDIDEKFRKSRELIEIVYKKSIPLCVYNKFDDLRQHVRYGRREDNLNGSLNMQIRGLEALPLFNTLEKDIKDSHEGKTMSEFYHDREELEIYATYDDAVFKCLGFKEPNVYAKDIGEYYFDGLKLFTDKLSKNPLPDHGILVGKRSQIVGRTMFLDVDDRFIDSFDKLKTLPTECIEQDCIAVRLHGNWLKKEYNPRIATHIGEFSLSGAITSFIPLQCYVRANKAHSISFNIIDGKIRYLNDRERCVIEEEKDGNTIHYPDSGETYTFTGDEFLEANLYLAKILVYKRKAAALPMEEDV